MRRFHTNGTAMTLCCLAIGVILTGCPENQEPTFTPGSGNDFGTLNDGQGNEFQIQVDEQEQPTKIIRSSSAGTSSFSFNDQLRLTELTATDGSKINFAYQQDGAATASLQGAKILLPFGQSIDLPDGQFNVPAGTLPNAKGIFARQAQAVDETTCELITDFCDLFPAANAQFRPLAVEFIVAQVAEYDSTINSDLVRQVVNDVLDKYLEQIELFCNGWNAILSAGLDPCAS